MSAPVETGGPALEPDDHTLLGLREMELNFGPQHPSTHGVLRIILKVDGERIVSARPEIGYLHRGTEKLFETETYPMVIPHTDRMDYVAAGIPIRNSASSATRNRSFTIPAGCRRRAASSWQTRRGSMN